MNNMFGAKMGQIYISMNERNEAAVGRYKFQEELARPVPKPILPGPPKQIFELKKLKSMLTPEESKRVQMEKQLKDYIATKPPKFSREDLLQNLMIKELLSKQLERNKKMREQVRRGYMTPEDYEKMKVKDSVLLGQVRAAMPSITEPLEAMGINTDQMNAYLNRPASDEPIGATESEAEVISRDILEPIERQIDAQERRVIETAPLVPTGGKPTGMSTATALQMQKRGVGRPPGTTKKALRERQAAAEEAAAASPMLNTAMMEDMERARREEAEAMEARREALRQEVRKKLTPKPRRR